MAYHILYSFLFFASISSISAQTAFTTKKTATGKIKENYEKGMTFLRNNDTKKALAAFENLLKKDPTFIDAQIEWAAIQGFDLKNYAEAEKGLEKALAISSDYDPKIYYSLSLMEGLQDKYAEAAEHLDIYLKIPSKNAILTEQAQKRLANYRFAAEAIKHPVPFEPKNLGDKVNTLNAEYLPTLTADGETLIYTARLRGQEDFYMSKKINGEWQAGTPLQDINTPENEGAQAISADGKFLVFTACNRKEGFGSCDIYFSELKNGKWTKPSNLGAPINSGAWESQPSLSADGLTMYFASDRKGGLGGKDIWVSTRKPDGQWWSSPKPLGIPINTPNDDQSPFIHPDGQTLYFMSNGLPGMGDHDLFFSRKQSDEKWSKPENLGYPINTRGNEGALVVSLDGKTAYFASDRKYKTTDKSIFDAEGGSETDLYSFLLYEKARPQPVTYLKAIVLDAQTEQPLSARIELNELISNTLISSSITDEKGSFLMCLPSGKNYALTVNKAGYLFHSENFALTDSSTLEKPFLLNIELVPIPPKNTTTSNSPNAPIAAQPIILRNIFFETGSAVLRKESFTELNRLKKLLEENPTMKIQINGHTDNIGSDIANLTLSQDRAKAVYNYLIQNNILANRLKFKGFGETSPINSNETAEGRQNNRRTEFIVIEN